MGVCILYKIQKPEPTLPRQLAPPTRSTHRRHRSAFASAGCDRPSLLYCLVFYAARDLVLVLLCSVRPVFLRRIVCVAREGGTMLNTYIHM